MVSLRKRSYLIESGKSIAIDYPGIMGYRVGDKASRREHERLMRAWKMDLKTAIPKVLTWARAHKGKVDYVDRYSVVRIESKLPNLPGSAGRDDYVLELYELDPGSKDPRNKVRATAWNRNRPMKGTIIGEYNNVRSAMKAAREWLFKTAV